MNPKIIELRVALGTASDMAHSILYCGEAHGMAAHEERVAEIMRETNERLKATLDHLKLAIERRNQK